MFLNKQLILASKVNYKISNVCITTKNVSINNYNFLDKIECHILITNNYFSFTRTKYQLTFIYFYLSYYV